MITSWNTLQFRVTVYKSNLEFVTECEIEWNLPRSLYFIEMQIQNRKQMKLFTRKFRIMMDFFKIEIIKHLLGVVLHLT